MFSTVSLNTYIFGVFACLFSYLNGVRSLNDILFYHTFIVMQLIEYFIWTKTFSNRLLSQIAFLAILSQPIFNFFRIRTKPEWIPYLLISYILFLVLSIIVILSQQSIDFSSLPSTNGHLS